MDGRDAEPCRFGGQLTPTGEADASQKTAAQIEGHARYSSRVLELLAVLCDGTENTRCGALLQDTLPGLAVDMPKLALETAAALEKVASAMPLGVRRAGATTRAERQRRNQLAAREEEDARFWTAYSAPSEEAVALAIESAESHLRLFTNLHVDTLLTDPTLHVSDSLWDLLGAVCGIMQLAVDGTAARRISSKGKGVSVAGGGAAEDSEAMLAAQELAPLPDGFIEGVLLPFLEAANASVLKGEDSITSETAREVKNELDHTLLNLMTEPGFQRELRLSALQLARALELHTVYPSVRNKSWADWEADLQEPLQLALRSGGGAKAEKNARQQQLADFSAQLADKPQEHFKFLVDIMVAPGKYSRDAEERDLDSLVAALVEVEETTGGGESSNAALAALGGGAKLLGGGAKLLGGGVMKLGAAAAASESAADVLKQGRKPTLCPIPFERLVRKLCQDLHSRMRVYSTLAEGGGVGFAEDDDDGGGAADGAHEALMLDVFRRVMGRWREKKTTGPTAGKSDAERAFMFSKRQVDLVSWGAMDIAVQAICLPHYQNLQGGHELVDAAIHLAQVLLENGNRQVQEVLFRKMTTPALGGEGTFGSFAAQLLRSIQQHLRQCVAHVRLHATAVAEASRTKGMDAAAAASAAGLKELEDEERAGLQKAFGYDARARLHSLLELLRQMCEGHNLQLQNLLREQPGSLQNFNIIVEVANVLAATTGSKDDLRGIQTQHAKTLQACLDFLVESMQGPCAENQQLIAEVASADAARITSAIIRIGDDKASVVSDGRKAVTKLKATTMLCMLSMLEGRSDSNDVHHVLLNNLGTATLKHRFEQVRGLRSRERAVRERERERESR